jgi:hypothetical protein
MDCEVAAAGFHCTAGYLFHELVPAFVVNFLPACWI